MFCVAPHNVQDVLRDEKRDDGGVRHGQARVAHQAIHGAGKAVGLRRAGAARAVLVRQEEVAQRRGVQKGLQHRVHIARIAQVEQPHRRADAISPGQHSGGALEDSELLLRRHIGGAGAHAPLPPAHGGLTCSQAGGASMAARYRGGGGGRMGRGMDGRGRGDEGAFRWRRGCGERNEYFVRHADTCAGEFAQLLRRPLSIAILFPDSTVDLCKQALST
ncbi:unnamed protein product [Chondrus crispus]|uniref:Uncharacterized protein n=1 Tax=Chondrus crispus TaxID=2769 RepID=R7QS86_CHOCR|nr:unnamed protein product [Chondrus crispus]CDF40593.1 unnamed protein product [Chondrus crispus]|eukprot:XP_005710887.1 unnamed protein product [Chondrus crispus]